MASPTTSPEVVSVESPERSQQSLHDSACKRASDLLWNNRFDDAAAALEDTRKRIPRHSLHYGESQWLKSLLLQSKAATSRAIELLNETIELAESFLDNHPKKAIAAGILAEGATQSESDVVKADLQIVQADANLLSAMLLVQSDHKLKGAWRLRKSWVVFSALRHKADALPSELNSCVDFGAGLFLFLVSWLPPMAAKVLEVVGFESNRRLGIDLLMRASESDGIRAPNASIIALVNLLIIPRALGDVNVMLAAANPIVTRALGRWPHGSMFQWMQSWYCRKSGDAAGGLAHMDEAIAAFTAATGNPPPTALAMDRACCLLMGLRWAEAAEVVKSIYQGDSGNFRALPRVLHAVCLQMLGDKDGAFAVLKAMPDESTIHGKDRMGLDVADRCLHRSSGLAIFPFELLYLRRDLAHMRPDTVRPLLAQMEANFSGPVRDAASKEEVALYSLVRGAMLRICGDDAAAIPEIKLAADASSSGNFKYEVHVCSFAHCELAEAAYKRGDLAETERLLALAAKHCPGGSMEDLIRPRLRIALEQIRVERAEIAAGKPKSTAF